MDNHIAADRLVTLNVSCRPTTKALAGLVEYAKLPQKQIVGGTCVHGLTKFVFFEVLFKQNRRLKSYFPVCRG
jgi:hypothetical protein